MRTVYLECSKLPSLAKEGWIFVYLPESEFSVENFRKIFDQYSAQYCDPYILSIYLFSDRAALDKQIKWEKHPGPFIDFSNTPEGLKASQEYDAKVLPPARGFLRAEYARYGDYEVIDYTRTKEEVANTRIVIQWPGVAPSGPRPCSRDEK